MALKRERREVKTTEETKEKGKEKEGRREGGKKKGQKEKEKIKDGAANSEGPACIVQFVSGCTNGNYSPNVSAEEASDCLPALTWLPAAACAACRMFTAPAQAGL